MCPCFGVLGDVVECGGRKYLDERQRMDDRSVVFVGEEFESNGER